MKPKLEQEIENTPVIPFEPIKPEKCKAYYNMSESMKKLLCDNCDKYGNVRYGLGIGRCRRYE